MIEPSVFRPLPPLSPSLINILVSVDVKQNNSHHIFPPTRDGDVPKSEAWDVGLGFGVVFVVVVVVVVAVAIVVVVVAVAFSS